MGHGSQENKIIAALVASRGIRIDLSSLHCEDGVDVNAVMTAKVDCEGTTIASMMSRVGVLGLSYLVA